MKNSLFLLPFSKTFCKQNLLSKIEIYLTFITLNRLHFPRIESYHLFFLNQFMYNFFVCFFRECLILLNRTNYNLRQKTKCFIVIFFYSDSQCHSIAPVLWDIGTFCVLYGSFEIKTCLKPSDTFQTSQLFFSGYVNIFIMLRSQICMIFKLVNLQHIYVNDQKNLEQLSESLRT